MSGHGKATTERGALTPCRQQREGFVRIRKQCDHIRCTYKLETAEGETCQDAERKRPREYSQTGECRGKGRPVHGIMCESSKRAIIETSGLVTSFSKG